MAKENVSEQFRLKKIDQTRNYFLKYIEQNELMSRRHRKFYTAQNYIKNFFILQSTITGRISISTFVSLVGIPIGITSSAIGLKNCAINARIKKYQQLGDESHKLNIKKIKKREVQSPFIDNSLGVDLVNTHLIIKFNKGIRFLLCITDIFSKKTWLILLNDKKVLQLLRLCKKY